MDIRPYGNDSGYINNQIYKQVRFQKENNMPLSQEASKYPAFNSPEFRNQVGCVGSYPLTAPQGVDYVSNNSYVSVMNDNYNNNMNNITQKPSYNFASESDIQFVPKLMREGFANVGGTNEYNTQLINDPTEDLLQIESRPITDFVHNNMVPFFGSSVKQNMAGTGVKSGNYTDGIDVNSGFDYTTPYKDKLNTFTGLDDTYLHKREIGPYFSPAEQQTNWVYGMPAFRPDEDRYTQSLFIRNDLAPCEPEMVGPGLALDPSIPAAGGFHDQTRVLPNNVSDYKANQLEGRVKAGKWQLGGGEPTSYPGVGLSGDLRNNQKIPGVVKNRPDKFWTQERYPTMTTKVGFVDNQEFMRPNYNVDKKPGNAKREQTNYGFGELIIPGTSPGTIPGN